MCLFSVAIIVFFLYNYFQKQLNDAEDANPSCEAQFADGFPVPVIPESIQYQMIFHISQSERSEFLAKSGAAESGQL